VTLLCTYSLINCIHDIDKIVPCDYADFGLFWRRFLVLTLNRKNCMSRQCLLLCMKCSRAITALFLRMDRPGQGRLTQWKEVQERRLFMSPNKLLFSHCFVLKSLSFFAALFCRMANFRVMLVSSREL